MNGGTLSTSFLKITDWGNAGRCVLNGVRLIGTTSAANANFIQVAFGVAGGAVTAPYGAYISNNGVLIDSGTNTLVIPVPLKHDFNGNVTDGGLIKLGSGMLTLSGTNTYNGATVVSNGTLSVNGSLTNANITVSAGATLTGSGTLRCRVSSASNDRITFLGTATLSGLTLALNVQGLLPAGSYVLAQGLGAAQFKAVTGVPQQAGQAVNVSYVAGQLVLVVSNKGTLISVF
jgi:autotransporter-associated beta strand protein